MDIFGLVEVLWHGFQAIGDALVGIVRALFNFFGLTVPEWTVELATIIMLVVIVFRYGKFIGKILLVVLLLLLASTLIRLLL